MCAGLASHGSKCVECQSQDWLLAHDGDGERCRPPKDEFHPDEHSRTGAVRAKPSRPTLSAPFRDDSFCRLPSDLSACWLAHLLPRCVGLQNCPRVCSGCEGNSTALRDYAVEDLAGQWVDTRRITLEALTSKP
eukprot:COSAG04_NODE_3293_length_2967_cov_1.585425_2_plen_134_part_00